MFQLRWLFRPLAIGVAVMSSVFVYQAANAQTGGPVQIDHLAPGAGGGGADVNTFTGAFSFSLPLLTVPGPQGSDYTISLGYQSNTSPDAGASWVGYGWSLNPGAIVRGTKGFPDDMEGNITVWNKRKRNWTVTAALRGGVEVNSLDLPELNGEYTASQIIRYNNNKGFSIIKDFSAKNAGYGSLNYNYDDIGNETFTAKISPQLILGGVYAGLNELGIQIPKDDLIGDLISFALSGASKVGAHAINQHLTFEPDLGRATRFPAFRGSSSIYNDGITIALNPAFVIGPEFGTGGTYSWQETVPKQSLKALGSMYSYKAGASDLLDYHTEKDGEFKRDDAFLPIPFAGTDEFLVTGNGGGGVFKLASRRTGIFRPNYVHNVTDQYYSETEFIWGARIGAGTKGGLGGGSAKVGQWNDDGLNAEYRFEDFSDARKNFFRFVGDRGGNLIKAHSDNAVRSTYEDEAAKIPSDVFALANEGEYVGRNSHIGFNLNRELLEKTPDRNVPFLAYDKDSALLSASWVKRDENIIKDQIGEICITGEGGSRYIYGLPVYARNEHQLQLNVGDLPQVSPNDIKSRSLAYAPLTAGTAQEAVGEERPLPYASTYLLSLITSSNYVDLTFDGPTPDDLGGYVKFNYLRTAGSAQKSSAQSDDAWFHWRAPYNGLFYDRNDLSDKTDDIGAYSSGEHEMYYVESIETKTHIAIFVNNKTDKVYGSHTVKGSGRERLDAYQAPYQYAKEQGLDYQRTAAGDSTASDAQWLPKSGGGYELRENKSRYLERIELYTKNENGDPDSLLSTVHLEYDYSLRKNMPNSALPHPDSTVRAGLLTMRRIWTQHQRVYNARITPYIFNYGYKRTDDFPNVVKDLYPAIVAHADTLLKSAENPLYNQFGLDAWGNNQYDGAARKAEGRNWLSQVNDKDEYDPAAWLLKGIKTPSQGEILVQYEQGDYTYVQDRPAHVMTSIRSSLGTSHSVDGDDNRYWIKLADLGIADTSRENVLRYFSLLKQHYAQKDERAYFKFLYALIGTSADFNAPGNTSAYINGHAVVNDIILDSVMSGSQMTYGIALRLRSEGVDSRMPDVPRKVCQEYVRTSKRGKLRDGDPIRFTDDGPQMIQALSTKFSEADYENENHCRAVDYSHSYIRLPAYHAKKGGAARVKRLLTLSDDSRNGSALFGTEYEYRVYDEGRREYISSGVAANEPPAIREENALVRPVFPAGKEDVRKKIISGPDRAQYEGPLGESLLPGPSIGYSRIVAKSIYDGKTAPGFSVSEFYTVRDYPLSYHIAGVGNSVDYTDIEPENEKENPLWALTKGLKILQWFSLGYTHEENALSATQGYRFIVNSMHGQFKRSASYGGIYENKDSWALSSLKEYTYFEPGASIPVTRKIGEPFYYDYIGKEMEVNIESRTIEDDALDGGLHGDVSFAPGIPFLPMVTGSGWVRNRQNSLNLQTISKVIRYPSILKGELSYADGIYHYSENRAFDPMSGSPVITRTIDGFDKLKLQGALDGHQGSYHSYTFMGHNEYPGLGQKGMNERVMLPSDLDVDINWSQPSGGSPQLILSSSSSLKDKQAALRLFTKGDLIRLTPADIPNDGNVQGFYHVQKTSGDTVILSPVSESLYFDNGTPSTSIPVSVRFIESGLANQSGMSVGSIVTYGEKKEAAESAENFSTDMSIQVPPRKWFADSLNTRLGNGGGFITAAQIQDLALQFIQPTSGGPACASLLDTLHISLGNGLVTLSLDRNPALCTDNFVMQGGPGHFDIDDHSRLIYVPGDRDLPVQPVNCLRFCPEETILRKTTLTNVIAAGAVLLTDSLKYDPEEYPAIPEDASQFESGIAGRWNSTFGYTYRTAITGGSNHSAAERNYNSGTFQDFTLFNWQNPELNDTLFWLRSGTVTRHSPHGEALESLDPIGIYSAAKMGYGDRLPILGAANAEYESVDFQDFENEDGIHVVEGEAHSGRKNLALLELGTTETNLHFTVTQQGKDNGMLLKFWMKTAKEELPANGVGFVDINLEYEAGGTDSVGLSPAHKVAQSGEWGLYEVHFESISASVGTPATVTITKYISPDIAFFDDMKIQPYDAVMQCVVYDTKTLRMVAAFGDDHFGVYPQYNAEGRVVRSIVETSRGIKTVAEAHSHMPSIPRKSGVTPRVLNGDGYGETVNGETINAARRTRSIDAPAGLPLDGNFELLDIELSPDKRKINVLGGRDKLPTIKDLQLPSGPDSLSLPGQMKELDRLRLLNEIKTLDGRLDEISRQSLENGAEETRQAGEEELRRLRERRSAILRELGISDEDLRQVLEEAGR